MTRLLLRKTKSSAGFSLVEVTVCLGIVTVVGMTVLGLLPQGLLNLRTAMNTTAESQIVEGITNNILLTSYKNLSNLYTEKFYYDVQGMPLNALGNVAPAGTIYTATIVDPNNPSNPAVPTDLSANFNGGSSSGATFSGLSGSAGLSAGVGTVVTIEVSKTNQPNSPDYFPIIVANTQGLSTPQDSSGN